MITSWVHRVHSRSLELFVCGRGSARGAQSRFHSWICALAWPAKGRVEVVVVTNTHAIDAECRQSIVIYQRGVRAVLQQSVDAGDVLMCVRSPSPAAHRSCGDHQRRAPGWIRSVDAAASLN